MCLLTSAIMHSKNRIDMLNNGTFSIVLIFYFSIEGSVSVIKLENQSVRLGHGSGSDDGLPDPANTGHQDRHLFLI